MEYADKLIIDCSTQVKVYEPMTDDDCRALPIRMALVADKTSVVANETDAATITLQLCTAELVTTGKPENIVESRDIVLIINNDPDETATVSLIDGAGAWQLAAALAGDYVVRGHDLPSNELTITATEV